MSPRRCSFSCPTSRATLRVRCWSSTAGWCCDRFPTPRLRLPMAMDMKQLEEKVKDIIVEELGRSEEHTSELQSRLHLVCRLLLEKKKSATQPCRSLVDTAHLVQHRSALHILST